MSTSIKRTVELRLVLSHEVGDDGREYASLSADQNGEETAAFCLPLRAPFDRVVRVFAAESAVLMKAVVAAIADDGMGRQAAPERS